VASTSAAAPSSQPSATTEAAAPVAPAQQLAAAVTPIQEEWSEAVSSKRKKKKAKPVGVGGGTSTTFITPQTATTTNGTTTTSTNGNNQNKNGQQQQQQPEILRVTVDPTKVGIIIGPKGSTLQALQAATGCKLDGHAPGKDENTTATTTTKNNNKPSKDGVVVISGGDATGRSTAKAAIRELVTKGYAKILQGDDFAENFVMVHPRHLSEIVGPGGRTIKALQSTLNVKVRIPSTDWKPNTIQLGQVPLAKVGIAGDKVQTQKAREVITSLTQYHHHEITHPGLIHEEVHVPPEFFHCIIGPRGSEIKHIKGNFQVDVHMPQDDSITPNVVVVGKQQHVDKAILYIHRLMERDTEQREQKYNDEFY
jgi:polyribonucleotide nucleotidyltransferase